MDKSSLGKETKDMLDEAEEALELLQKKHETSQSVAKGSNSWIDAFKEFENIDDLRREAVALFIRNIMFNSDRKVEISFVYQTELDELNKISDNLKSEQMICSEAV